MEQEKYNEAIFGLNLQRKYQWQRKVLSIVQLATHGYPIYKCICYSRLGEQDKAYYYNELAASYVPNNAAIEYNRKYFRGFDKPYKV